MAAPWIVLSLNTNLVNLCEFSGFAWSGISSTRTVVHAVHQGNVGETCASNDAPVSPGMSSPALTDPGKLYLLFLQYLFIFGCAGSSLLHQGVSLGVANGGYSLVAELGLLIAGASLVAEHRSQGTRASVVATRGLSSHRS